MEHKTSLKSLGYICSNSQQYIVWVKIIHISFMPKIISILSKDHVPLICAVFLHCLSICKLLLFFLHCLSICKLFVVFLHCLSIGKLFVVFLHCLSIGKLFVVFLHCLSIGKLSVVVFLHCLEHAHKNFTHQGTCAVVM